MTNNNNILRLEDKLSLQAFAIAIALAEYIEFNSCRLINKNKQRLKLKDICTILKKTKPTVIKYLRELETMQVIIKHKYNNAQYFVFNPFICCKGTNIDLETIGLFKDSQWNTHKNDVDKLIRTLCNNT